MPLKSPGVELLAVWRLVGRRWTAWGVLFVIVMFWVAPAGAHGPHGCEAPGSKVLASTDAASVFKLRGFTYGCLRSRQLRVKLGEYVAKNDYGESGQRNAVLAGRYVAFETYSVGRGSAIFRIEVVDLRTGVIAHQAATGPVSPGNDAQQEAVGIGPTTTIRLRATGQVAWIATDPYATPMTAYVVRKIEKRYSVRLDAGAAVAPKSLGLSGSVLRWRNGSEPRSAQLGEPPAT
jgi:lipoprotein-anchoring transpeptidase ErfK/SrfK